MRCAMSQIDSTTRRRRSQSVRAYTRAFAVTIGFLFAAPCLAELPAALDDATFSRLMQTLSEPEGRFAPQYMSNEDSLQYVLPELVQRAPTGGVYIGVGSEQNFTYMAALKPALAFIVDIRRDNLRQVLLYKALFEIAPDRAGFIAKLFSRPLPQRFDASGGAPALFAAFRGTAADPAVFEATRAAVLANLGETHAFALDADDRAAIVRILEVFRDTSPDLLKGFGDTTNPTFAELMAATDLAGKAWGFLASEANYAVIRDLNQRNLIVPVVGDFAGDVALPGIGRFLKERDAAVRVFYVSNVERYLWEQGEHGQGFYANLAQLPLDDASLFVRSVTSDISIPPRDPDSRPPREVAHVREADPAGYRSRARWSNRELPRPLRPLKVRARDSQTLIAKALFGVGKHVCSGHEGPLADSTTIVFGLLHDADTVPSLDTSLSTPESCDSP